LLFASLGEYFSAILILLLLMIDSSAKHLPHKKSLFAFVRTGFLVLD